MQHSYGYGSLTAYTIIPATLIFANFVCMYTPVALLKPLEDHYKIPAALLSLAAVIPSFRRKPIALGTAVDIFSLEYTRSKVKQQQPTA